MKLLAVNIGNSFNSPFTQLNQVGGLVSLFLSNVFVVAGVIFLFLLILAGFSIIMGAGSGEPAKVDGGKKAATAAVAGLIIIFVSYWVVKLIQAITGINILGN